MSGKTVVVTQREKVVIGGSDHVIPACNHEEADTRLLFHVQDALQQASKTWFVCTVDTNVIIILIDKFYHLQAICPTLNIWVVFDTGRAFPTFTSTLWS